MRFTFIAKHQGAGRWRGFAKRWMCRARAFMPGSIDRRAGVHATTRRSATGSGQASLVRIGPMVPGVSGGTCWRKASLHRIERLMHAQALRARPRRRSLPRDDGQRSAIAPNTLGREFHAERPNQRWIADFTDIWTAEGWLYVAAVIDLFSRRVVGWSMKAEMTAGLVIDALMMAIWRRGKPDALLHHSDQGSQYASEQFQKLMTDNGVTCSMSRSGNVWDNAAMESFFSSLKTERIRGRVYRTRDDARADVFDYIERFYNRASEHPSGYVIEVKRFCCAGGDPAGYFGFCRALAVMDWAASVARAARAKTQGPSGRGWVARISPASAASLSVLVETFRSLAASVRLSQGSTPSAAGLNTGIR
jgi:putative transposase